MNERRTNFYYKQVSSKYKIGLNPHKERTTLSSTKLPPLILYSLETSLMLDGFLLVSMCCDLLNWMIERGRGAPLFIVLEGRQLGGGSWRRWHLMQVEPTSRRR